MLVLQVEEEEEEGCGKLKVSCERPVVSNKEAMNLQVSEPRVRGGKERV